MAYDLFLKYLSTIFSENIFGWPYKWAVLKTLFFLIFTIGTTGLVYF